MDRIKICLGYSPGELLPPYDREDYYDLDRINRIVNLVSQDTKITKRQYFARSMKDMDQSSVVEVMGAWGDYCVAIATGYGLTVNKTVIINPDLVVFPFEVHDELKRKELLERFVREQFLRWRGKGDVLMTQSNEGLVFRN